MALSDLRPTPAPPGPLGERFDVLVRLPIVLSDESEPEPDVTVVVGGPEAYTDRHPGASDVALVVEVADRTLAFDRTVKASLYAEAGIADYWIVNLSARQVEVHRQPQSPADSDAAWRYASVEIASEADTIAPLAGPQATVAVSSVLPPAA